MDNDAHDLAVAMMRRLEMQDRRIEALTLRVDKVQDTQAEIREMLSMMGDQCYALAAAAERLTADL